MKRRPRARGSGSQTAGAEGRTPSAPSVAPPWDSPPVGEARGEEEGRGALFLDGELRLRRFTPWIGGIFGLGEADLGRSLADLAGRVGHLGLVDDVLSVRGGAPRVEREVVTAEGRSFLLRVTVRPERESGAEELLLTFVEVTEIRRAQREIERLNELLRQRVLELEARARQQAAVVELGLQALSAGDDQDAFDQAVRSVAETLGVSMVSVLELDARRARLRLRATVGLGPGAAEVAIPAGPGSQAGYTLDAGLPVVVEDLAREERFRPSSLLLEGGAVAGMTVAIEGRDGPWGVFSAHCRQPRRFTGDDVNFLRSVANLLSAAIERSRVEEELRSSREELALRVTRERLQRTERLAALGTLAAGIAHEINNPVNSILMTAEYSQLSLERPGNVEQLRESLGIIVREAERCGAIVKSVLGFARGAPSAKLPSDLNEIVRRGVTLAREEPGRKGAVVELRLAEGLPALELNPMEIEQVVVNLVRNGLEASGGKARVEVSTERVGHGVRLSVRDFGPGISSDVIDRVFDPFFSTRRERGGTGLGLSLAHRVVTDHGGVIDVESEEGVGSIFVVDLPAVRA